ncbi:hypothetical protein KFE25_002652 [Diacronema lutheri]|uniref:TOD1/MUCI70 glycosyltransferase-like domain-containing protein n=2 Tax=Diacronema lutheri TaxID=2081491 RepID=A0A8J5XN02_DIALT|nr:hypothetical protein KFE25_002652 [Diacronema lutheri]
MAVGTAGMVLTPSSGASCDSFHGCPTMADRNRTYALAQMCALRRWPEQSATARACAAMGVGTSLDAPEQSGERAYCGFGSPRARAWLGGVHRAADGCAIVLFTVIVGSSDTLAPFPADEHSGGAETVCAIALVDAPQLAAGANATRALPTFDTGPPSWRRVALPAERISASPGRTAHAFKASMLALFPRAEWVVYADAKTVLRLPPRALVRRLAALTALPLIVFQHPWNTSPELEAHYSRVRVRFQRRPAWRQDVADITRAEARYRKEGAYNNQPGMLDAFVVAQQRAPAAAMLAGRTRATGHEPPTPRAVLQAFECAWFCEIWLLSMSEQVSFYYTLDTLGARRHSFVVPTALYNRNELDKLGKRQQWFDVQKHTA